MKTERKEKAKKQAEAEGLDEAGVAAAVEAAANYVAPTPPADAPAVEPPVLNFSIGDELQTFSGETVICGRKEEADIHLKGADTSVSRVQVRTAAAATVTQLSTHLLPGPYSVGCLFLCLLCLSTVAIVYLCLCLCSVLLCSLLSMRGAPKLCSC